MGYLDVATRAGLAVVFVLAAAGKLAGRSAWSEFERSVRQLTGTNPGLAARLARLTVAAELATVLLVLVPLRLAGLLGCALALILTIGFTLTIVGSLGRGDRTPCRCFGRSNTPLGRRHLVRNALLLALSVLGLLAQVAAPPVPATTALVGAAAGLFAGMVIAGFDDIAQLLAPAT